MPVDYKRITGPEDSVPYQLFSDKKKKTHEEKCKELIDNNGKRADGRSQKEHRKIFIKTNIVSQAKGSAYIEVDKTKVIVSVFDPREIPNRNEYTLHGELYCEFKYATFSCLKRRNHQQDLEEKEYSVILRRSLEPVVCRHEFPNFQVDIYALVLENDGSALSAAITCAGLALAQAGIPMYDLITAVTIGQRDDIILVDPTYEEEILCHSAPNMAPTTYENLRLESGPEEIDSMDCSELSDKSEHGIILLSLLSTHQQVTEFYQTGSMRVETLTEMTELLIKLNNQIVPLVQKCLVKYIQKSLTRNEIEKKNENNVL